MPLKQLKVEQLKIYEETIRINRKHVGFCGLFSPSQCLKYKGMYWFIPVGLTQLLKGGTPHSSLLIQERHLLLSPYKYLGLGKKNSKIVVVTDATRLQISVHAKLSTSQCQCQFNVNNSINTSLTVHTVQWRVTSP